MKMCVDVIEQAIPSPVGSLSGISDGRPDVELLLNRTDLGVITREGIESTKCSPSRAERLRSVAAKAADIGTDHWNLEQGGEFEDLGNAGAVVVPEREVVT